MQAQTDGGGVLPQAQKTLKKGSGGRGVILIALEHKEITRGMGQRKRVQIMPRGGKMNPTNDDKTLLLNLRRVL